jgi:hypothetical protein
MECSCCSCELTSSSTYLYDKKITAIIVPILTTRGHAAERCFAVGHAGATTAT